MATLAVVFLHTNSALSSNAIQFGLTEDQIKSSTIYYLCMTWSVPIFVMITGALLLNPDKKNHMGKLHKEICEKNTFDITCIWHSILDFGNCVQYEKHFCCIFF